jgi:hypothetical protein
MTGFLKNMTGFYEYTKGIYRNMTGFLKNMSDPGNKETVQKKQRSQTWH